MLDVVLLATPDSRPATRWTMNGFIPRLPVDYPFSPTPADITEAAMPDEAV